MKPTLRFKFVSIVLLVAIPFLIFSIIDNLSTVADKKQALIHRNSLNAREVASGLDEFIETSQNILYSLALHPAIINNDRKVSDDLFARLHPLYPLHLNILAADMTGRNIASAIYPENTLSLNHSGKDWFIKGSSGVSVVTDLHISELFEHPTFMITMPVFKETGAQSAVLGFPVNLYKLQEHFMEREGAESKTSISVIDNNGKALICSEDKNIIGKPYSMKSVLREIGKSATGSLTETDSYGVKRVYSYATVETTGWKVLLGVPASEIYREATQGALRHLLFFILLCGVGTFLAFFYSKRLAERVESLIKGFHEISTGNLTYRVIMAGNDELANAGKAFNSMIEEHENSQNEIKCLAESLERKVQHRTAELLNSKNELEAFSYAVSHDLHAPVRHILAFTHILLEGHSAELSDEGRDHLQRINRAGENMREMITHLLDLSRLHRKELNCVPVNVSALSNSIITDLAEAEPDRIVDAVVTEGLTASADQGLLRVVLQNLIGNAWKYTRNSVSPKVEVGETVANGIHCFFVKDNGCGFDMAYADKLFTPFQRLHSSEDFEGTGIGLATVMRIVQRHGGKLWAESTPGQGAVFYFTMSLEV